MSWDTDKANPCVKRLIDDELDRVLLSRGLDLTSPTRDHLLARVEVLFGYQGQPLVRLRDDSQTLLPADIYLDQLLAAKEYAAPKSPAGPTRIPMSDKQALLGVDVTKVGSGEIVVFDDRQ
jgi:hypothetical protein